LKEIQGFLGFLVVFRSSQGLSEVPKDSQKFQSFPEPSQHHLTLISPFIQVLRLNFGNWEIFKLLVISLRDIESNAKSIPTIKNDTRDNSDGASSSQLQPQPSTRKQKSVIEKQVRLSIHFLHSRVLSTFD
jgi:hypothetical protein